jgi:ArsR family transcriptional regulator
VCAAGGCCRPPFTVSIDTGDNSELAQGFKALGDTVRLTLLSLLAAAGDEVCVCDLSAGFDLTGPTISHHLKVLHEAGLVERERRGTWVYYRLQPHRLRRLSRQLDAAVGLITDEPTRGAGSGVGVAQAGSAPTTSWPPVNRLPTSGAVR